jgi:hypothetical protein
MPRHYSDTGKKGVKLPGSPKKAAYGGLSPAKKKKGSAKKTSSKRQQF